MKKTLAVCLCAVLCLAAVGVTASADSDVFFAAVDYDILPLETANMPMRSGGTLYAPVAVFTPATGIYSSRSDDGRLVRLFARDKELTFDIDAAVAYDRETQYSYRALRQNGVYYLPVETVCHYFGISWIELSSNFGPLLRLRIKSTADTDQNFLDAARSILKERYETYKGATSPSPASSAASPTATPPTPTPTPSRPIAYLTFDDGPAAAYSHRILDILDEYGVKATFFLLGENMRKEESAVRRMVASGHAVGLHSFTHQYEEVYASPEALIDEMNRTNDRLEEITMFRSRLVRLPFGSGGNKKFTEEMCQALTNAGFRFWDWNVDGDQLSPERRDTPEKIAAGVISDLQNSPDLTDGRPAIILLHEREKTVEALPAILDYMKSKNYIFVACDPSERPFNRRSWIK